MWPIFACTTVDLEKFSPWHAVNWYQQCQRQWSSAFLTYGTADKLRLRLHWLHFLCICCKLACMIRRQQVDQVELGVIVYVCANNCVATCFKYRSQHFTCCMVISLGMQRDMVDFAWGSIALSIGVSRYTCSEKYCKRYCHYFLVILSYHDATIIIKRKRFNNILSQLLKPHIKNLYVSHNTHFPASVAVERLFSLGGRVFAPLRSRLTSELLWNDGISPDGELVAVTETLM